MNRVTKMSLVLAALTVVSGVAIATPAQAYPHFRDWGRHEQRIWRHERFVAAHSGYCARSAYPYSVVPGTVPVWTQYGY